MAGSQSTDYQPNAEMLPIIMKQYNVAKMKEENQNTDLMCVNRIKLLVIASKEPHYAVARAIRSAHNQLSQIVGYDYRYDAKALINQLESIK